MTASSGPKFEPPRTIDEIAREVGALRAVELINASASSLLMQGQVTYLHHELQTEAARPLLEQEPSLAPAVLKTCAVLAFSEPEKAGALLDLLHWGYEAPTWLEDRAFLAMHFAPAYQQAGGAPEALHAVLTLLPVADELDGVALIRAAVEELRRTPAECCAALERLPAGLLEAVGRAASELSAPESVPLPQEEPRRSECEPALLELFSSVEAQIDQDSTNRLWSLALLVGGLAGCAAWWRFGWVGAGAGALLFAAVSALPAAWIDARLYSAYLRPALLRHVLYLGGEPEHFVHCMRRLPWTHAVRRFTSEVEGDGVLLFVSQLVSALRRGRAR